MARAAARAAAKDAAQRASSHSISPEPSRSYTENANRTRPSFVSERKFHTASANSMLSIVASPSRSITRKALSENGVRSRSKCIRNSIGVMRPELSASTLRNVRRSIASSRRPTPGHTRQMKASSSVYVR